MNPDDLLLRDIHLPDPLSWWPPAPGWWLLAGACLIIGVGTTWWLRRRAAQRRAPATLARRDLERVRTAWSAHGDAARLVGELSVWLRRTGMSLTQRAQAASLTGDAWRQFLDGLAGEPVFADAEGARLLASPYRTSASVHIEPEDAERLLGACEQWLRAATGRRRNARA
jgi:hypothetical protein